jgi:hypothetical protein
MLRRLPVVFCCELMMFGRLLVMFSTLMSCHVLYSFCLRYRFLPSRRKNDTPNRLRLLR